MPAVTPTLIMGVLGIVLSAPAWVLFIRAARRLYLFIAAGQPAPGRTNRPLRRGVQVLKEVFFHTELMRRPAIAVAHWFVMVGFLIGSLVWFEAYIQTFNPAGGWPLLSQWSLYHFAEEVLAIGTVLGIGFLFAIRLSTGMRERLSRFYGSNALSAFFVEGVIFLEGAGMLLVKAGKIATYGHASPWADFFTQYLARFLPASPIMVSVFALFKLLVGMVWLVVVARNLTWGVAWHRFLAFFNIFFQRNPDGAPALGKVLPLYDGTTELTIDTIEEDSSLGIGHLQDAGRCSLTRQPARNAVVARPNAPPGIPGNPCRQSCLSPTFGMRPSPMLPTFRTRTRLPPTPHIRMLTCSNSWASPMLSTRMCCGRARTVAPAWSNARSTLNTSTMW